MATVSDAIQRIIREEITPGIEDALIEQDPLFGQIKNSSMGVVRSGIGRDWKVIKTLITSLAGSFKASGAVGGDTIVAENNVYTVHSAPGTFPTVAGFVSPGYLQKEFTLQEMVGNMFIPQEFLRADQLTASLGSAVAAVIRQTARMIALVKAGWFFSTDQTNKILGKGDGARVLSSNSTDPDLRGDATNAVGVTLTLHDESRSRGLAPGVCVDLYSADGQTKRNDKTLVIHSVDPATKEVRIDSADGTNPFSGQVVNSDLIVLKDSKGNGPAGLESWILATGTLYTNLALATYPQFKSLVTAVNGSLTDDILRKQLATFIQGWGASQAPDTLLTTEGVLNDYVDQVESDRRWAVQGSAQKVVGGYDDGVKFVLDGRVFNFKTGSLVGGGRLYGLKLKGDNIKRYMPPKLPGASSRSEFDNIEFVAPLGGSKDIWKHAHYNSATTKYVEAPFVCIEEIVPDQIPAIKLTGLTEDLL